MYNNGLYVLLILSSITMMFVLEMSTLPMFALVGAIAISVLGMYRNKTRKQV
ncbi:hypothetical protein [Paenibacillus macquariensis]|uniref:Uncharacterized protein n=1 Tax=Paenibacillus macquariensis TaxID=948756 RepID=A0ABY1JKR9_9BACL|nr:hypothetical protein [Paenibacillus macquariensis]MEC0089899.1 hypothetical protein [Paenibacillus macquariensis]SIQ33890.1 hypothetical protein SAMN05421578_101285 [Paenibacillus macquariensis]